MRKALNSSSVGKPAPDIKLRGSRPVPPGMAGERPMKSANLVLVTGGTGVLGPAVTKRLTAAGYTVRNMSRRAPPVESIWEPEWAQVDLETGLGLAEAVWGPSATNFPHLTEK